MTRSKMLEYIGFVLATRICRKASTAPNPAEIQLSTKEPSNLRDTMSLAVTRLADDPPKHADRTTADKGDKDAQPKAIDWRGV
jgi:hypothetical protein